jgi:uncharacterized protein (DUF4415 family)|tara:strand:- start:6359 stop:6922 length:564 start_codon:yes stop_codon:yes gene_type:complete
MAKVNYELLRQRIHWVDLYATGKTRDEVAGEFKGEGATLNSVRTVIQHAQKSGLISGSQKHGSEVTIDIEARGRLVNSGEGTIPFTAKEEAEVAQVMKKRERLVAAFTESQKVEIAQIVAQTMADQQKASKEELGERVESLREKEEKTLVNFRLEESLLERLDAFGRARGITKRIDSLRAMIIASDV